MSDSYGDPQENSRAFQNRRTGFRGGRGPGNRDSGGFRIRLSENEMRASRSIQEAFNLKSTVAVLGFALRTLGQMLEEGKLDDLIAQNAGNTKNKNFNPGIRGNNSTNFNQSNKANPFARPSKPKVEETNLPTTDDLDKENSDNKVVDEKTTNEEQDLTSTNDEMIKESNNEGNSSIQPNT